MFCFLCSVRLASFSLSIFPPYLHDGKLPLTSPSTICGTQEMSFWSRISIVCPTGVPCLSGEAAHFCSRYHEKPPSRTRDSSTTKQTDELTTAQRLKHVNISFESKSDRHCISQRRNALSETFLPSLANEWLRRMLSCANRPHRFSNA